MKRHLTILMLISCGLTFSQRINYYNLDAYIKSDVKIKSDINIKATVDKYTTVIDYGKIAEANVEFEKNRFEREKYNNKIANEIASKVSTNPELAIDYGLIYYWRPKNVFGIKRATVQFVYPNLFFTQTNTEYIHNGPKGITTRLNFYIGHPNGKDIPISLKGASSDDVAKYQLQEGVTYYDGEIPLNVVAVEKDFGSISSISGFKYSAAMEGDAQIMITDQIAASIVDGIRILVVVKYTGSKKNVSFLELKQQQEYFNPLIEKFCSKIKILDYKLERF